MSLLRRIPLRHLLPILIGVFAALIAVLSYVSARPALIRAVETNALEQLNAELTQTQGMLQILLRKADLSGTRSVVTAYGADPEHLAMFLTDGDGRVLASTRLADIGEKWTGIAPQIDPALVEHVGRTGGAYVHLAQGGRSVAGYISVCAAAGQSLRPTACGFVYRELGIAARIAAVVDGLRREAIYTGLGIAALAFVLWAVLHFRLTRRIDRLIDTARAFAEGEQTARTNLRGRDELSNLGSELNGMLDKLAQDSETLRVYERAMNSAINGILIADAQRDDNPIVYINAGFERITGYTADDVLGRNCRFLQGDDREQPARAELSAAIGEQRPVSVLIRNYRKDGSLFWNQLHLTPVRDDAGKVSHFIGIQFDVTEMRKLEAARQVSEARFKDFAETSADWFWEMGPDLRFTHMSGNVEGVLGVKPEAMIGRTRREMVPPSEDDAVWTQHYADLEAREPFRDLEVSWTCPDGSKRFLVLNGRPMFDDDGEFLGYRGTGWDYTALHHAETELRQNHALLEQRVTERTQSLHDEAARRQLAEAQARTLFEHAPDAIVIIDSSGKIELANAQAERILGYSPAELVGQPIEFLVPERFRAGHIAQRDAFLDSPAPRPMGIGLELYGLCSDGVEIPIEVSLSPIQTEHGLVVAASIRDITERKATELALRTAKEAAEKATATKTRFLAAASHDLRQPLQSLEIYMSVLSRTKDTQQAKALQDKMQQSLSVMGELLNALLDISKLDSGSVEPETRDFELQPLLDRIIASAAPHAHDDNLELRCAKTSCVVHSDPALLERILENLVGNAIRYTDRGSVAIECPMQGDAVRIEIRDTGIGIPEHAKSTIFEEYVQLDNPVRDRKKGLGLGLAIVKHIADLLGHSLELASVPGGGSTFSVVVPLGERATTFEVPRHAPQETPAEPRALTVLFVDDDTAIVDAVSLLLSVSGFSVHTALNGEDAKVLISQGLQPDVVVSDYRLPGANGIELIRQIREQSATELPAILMTGDTTDTDIQTANLTRFRIMHKPVNGERLIELIQQLSGATEISSRPT